MSRLSDKFRTLPALQARQRIPPHKRRAQWRNSLIGIGIIALAFLLRWKLAMPWPAVYVGVFVGGFIISKDLTLTLIKVIPEAIAAVAGAFTKKEA